MFKLFQIVNMFKLFQIACSKLFQIVCSNCFRYGVQIVSDSECVQIVSDTVCVQIVSDREFKLFQIGCLNLPWRMSHRCLSNCSFTVHSLINSS